MLRTTFCLTPSPFLPLFLGSLVFDNHLLTPSIPSTSQQLRTTYTPSNPDSNYNPSADSSTAFPFPFPRLTPTLTPGGGSVPTTPGLLGMMTPGSGQGSNPGQTQGQQQAQGFVVGQGAAGMTGMAGDVFGSGSAGGAGSGSYASMNGQGESGRDYLEEVSLR